MKWEYYVVTQDHVKLEGSSLGEVLRALGADGWELVAIAWEALWLKRRVMAAPDAEPAPPAMPFEAAERLHSWERYAGRQAAPRPRYSDSRPTQPLPVYSDSRRWIPRPDGTVELKPPKFPEFP